MIDRISLAISATVLFGLVAGCSDTPERPASPEAAPSATTDAAIPDFPSQGTSTPGQPALVAWVALAAPDEGDEVLDQTIGQLADVGYEVLPMDLSCQAGTLEAFRAFGLDTGPGSRGVGLVLEDAQAVEDFSVRWQGTIFGVVDGVLECDPDAG